MWNLKTQTMIAFLGLATIGIIFSLNLAGCNREEYQVGTENSARLSEANIPAIDADAPVVTETATFSLG